ncbi:MAG: ribonuclease HII [Bacteroidota bacterium]
MLISFSNRYVEAGCDEAGRGCLAGPVFAAAVILPADFYHPKLNDSKQLSESDREELRPFIEQYASSCSVQQVDEREIDQINILNASFKAMHLAIDDLRMTPELLLIDGNRFTPYLGIPHQCIIKGDSKYASIAAASVLAKTYRDDHMRRLSDEFPQYGWEQNKGYATMAHRLAMRDSGPCKYHRQSFKVKGLERHPGRIQ